MSEILNKLRTKLQARQNKPGFGANCNAIQARIYELEAASQSSEATPQRDYSGATPEQLDTPPAVS